MATIDDVAKVVGVSPSTVSRALSRPDMVSRATRERIVDAAQQLGYPVDSPRAPRPRSAQMIALLIPDLLHPFYTTIARGVQDVAEQYEHQVLFYNTAADVERENRMLEQALQQKAQGLLLVPSTPDLSHLAALDLPVIEIDRFSGTPGVNSVVAENVRGVVMALEHLIGLGHRRIGIIGGVPESSSTREKLEGYRQAMAHAQLAVDPSWVRFSQSQEEGGKQATLELLALPTALRPTALFACDSETAAGMVRAVRGQGLAVPQELSLIGFDDSRWAQIMDPPLTVVDQPAYEMGRVACDLLFQQLQRDFRLPALQIRLATQLVVRHSTAPPPSASGAKRTTR